VRPLGFVALGSAICSKHEPHIVSYLSGLFQQMTLPVVSYFRNLGIPLGAEIEYELPVWFEPVRPRFRAA